MRDYKFRAWLPGLKKMTNAHTLDDLVNWGLKDSRNRGTAIWEQFTGLRDKNGKEIYEGDVVDCHRSGDEEYTVRVSVDDIRNLPRALFGSNLLWREVIGNIHEHPHLLEGGELRG